MENSISDASILVIGASAGIGREVARAFADRGARVMAVGRREANLRELAEGSRVEWTAADITEPGEPERVVARAVAAFGGLDIVVNVAAASPMGLLADADPDADVVRVRVMPSWLRIDARYGSVFRRRGDPALLLG